MEKILVQLHVPAIELKTDALLPSSIRVESATELLAEAVETMSRGFYHPTGSEVVCVERLGRVLVPGTDISMYGLMNGDRLVLI